MFTREGCGSDAHPFFQRPVLLMLMWYLTADRGDQPAIKLVRCCTDFISVHNAQQLFEDTWQSFARKLGKWDSQWSIQWFWAAIDRYRTPSSNTWILCWFAWSIWMHSKCNLKVVTTNRVMNQAVHSVHVWERQVLIQSPLQLMQLCHVKVWFGVFGDGLQVLLRLQLQLSTCWYCVVRHDTMLIWCVLCTQYYWLY